MFYHDSSHLIKYEDLEEVLTSGDRAGEVRTYARKRGFVLPPQVELPGIEPGSSVTLPGLLRAQFAQNLYSALWIGRTRPDDGPSWRYKVPPNPVNTAGQQVP